MVLSVLSVMIRSCFGLLRFCISISFTWIAWSYPVVFCHSCCRSSFSFHWFVSAFVFIIYQTHIDTNKKKSSRKKSKKEENEKNSISCSLTRIMHNSRTAYRIFSILFRFWFSFPSFIITLPKQTHTQVYTYNYNKFSMALTRQWHFHWTIMTTSTIWYIKVGFQIFFDVENIGNYHQYLFFENFLNLTKFTDDFHYHLISIIN